MIEKKDIVFLRELANKGVVMTQLLKRPINDWSRLCSALDWAQMGFIRLESGYSCQFDDYRLYDYISAIDVILESLNLINEIFDKNVENPLEQTNHIKGLDIFNRDCDSLNIKRLIEMFGAHPIGLKIRNGKESKKYYCSWPNNLTGENEVSLLIYSEEHGVNNIIKIQIKMSDLDNVMKELKIYIEKLCTEMQNFINTNSEKHSV